MASLSERLPDKGLAKTPSLLSPDGHAEYKLVKTYETKEDAAIALAHQAGRFDELKNLSRMAIAGNFAVPIIASLANLHIDSNSNVGVAQIVIWGSMLGVYASFRFGDKSSGLKKQAEDLLKTQKSELPTLAK